MNYIFELCFPGFLSLHFIVITVRDNIQVEK